MYIRMKTSTHEERRRLTEAAHAAVRGKPQSHQTKVNIAKGKQRLLAHRGPADAKLAEMLANRGWPGIEQLAADVYNIDIGYESLRVAVEVCGGGWHGWGTKRTADARKFKYLTDRGWLILCVYYTQSAPITEEAAGYIVTLLESVSRGEPRGKQYRVILGDGRPAPVLRCYGYDVPAVPGSARRDDATGQYLGIA
jgi:very-short-patch-repair endonuclease